MKRFIKYQIVVAFVAAVFLSLGESAHSQNILKGPYIIEPGETEISIRWEISEKDSYDIEFGTDTTNFAKQSLSYREGKYNAHLYEATLSSLKEKTQYYYG